MAELTTMGVVGLLLNPVGMCVQEEVGAWVGKCGSCAVVGRKEVEELAGKE